MDKLLPCPFCEHKMLMPHVKARTAKTAGGYHYFVRCQSCHTEGPRSLSSKADAIDKWNRRAGPAQGDGKPVAINAQFDSALNRRKLTDLAQRGHEITGHILYKDGKYALFDGSCRWLTQPQYQRLMHEQNGSLFAPAQQTVDLSDEKIEEIWESLPGLKIISGRPQDQWNRLLRHEYARALLAAQKGESKE